MLQPALILSVVFLALPANAEDSGAKVDFERDVRPVLVAHCYACHGPNKQKSGLRLDRKSDALKGGDSGQVVVPGKGAESLIVQLTSGQDADRVMPPKGPRLTSEQIGTLRTWIDQGAAWPEAKTDDDGRSWWSLQPLIQAIGSSAELGPEDPGPQSDRCLHPAVAAERRGFRRLPRPTAGP